MNNKIFDINEEIDFNIFNLGNPSLINNNTYFSKLTYGDIFKNFYIKFPKCYLKNSFNKDKIKSISELIFNFSETNIIKFFEKFENYIIEQIYKKKDLWFYNHNELEKSDIEDLIVPYIKTYKNGKEFIIKTNCDINKIKIYDENEVSLNYTNLTSNDYIIPLLSINGVKFTTKNFIIETSILQILVLNNDEFLYNECLIKLNRNEETDKKIDISSIDTKKNEEFEIEIDNTDNTENTENTENSENTETTENIQTIQTIETIENTENVDKSYHYDDTNNNNNNDVYYDDTNNNNNNNNNNNDVYYDDNVEEKEIKDLDKNNKNSEIIDINLDNLEINNNLSKNNSNNINFNKNENLVNISANDLENNDVIQIKSRDDIYLEIYKNARKKAKQIRNNAIKAFLDAKKIKIKYNLEDLINSDSESDSDNDSIINN